MGSPTTSIYLSMMATKQSPASSSAPPGTVNEKLLAPTAAIVVGSPADTMPEVEVQPVPLASIVGTVLCGPLNLLMCCGMYTVETKTSSPGLHCGSPFGRQIRTVSTKTRTMELPTSK